MLHPTNTENEALRRLALQHLWMHNADWEQMDVDGEPLIVVGGQGLRVTDAEGNQWIDVNGGYASVNIGYGRTEVADAADAQMRQIAYFPQRAANPSTIRLAAKLAAIAPGSLSRTFFVSGGSEANETALKIARAYHHRHGEQGRYKIISRKGSYHGATGGVLWLGSVDGRDDYEPPYPGMLYAPQPDTYRCEFGSPDAHSCAMRCADAIEQLIQTEGPETVAAVIAEPIASGPGAAVPGDVYWPMVRAICDRYGVLLIVDEIVTGFGRTGTMFALEHWGVVPDIMTIAKGMSSTYLPLGAAVVCKEIADEFAGSGNQLHHVFTAAGHPVAAAAGLRNIEIIESEGLVENAVTVGSYFKNRLQGLYEKHAIIGDVRGIGLMLSMEFVADRPTKQRFPAEASISRRLTTSFKKRALLLRAHGDTIVNMSPPLCITTQDVDEIVGAIDESLAEVETEIGVAALSRNT
jgi:adenosylmethionine-8-amino-7-oxononanoate aminotransferase